MAEFQEVMKQMKRMCQSYSTVECENGACKMRLRGACAMNHIPAIAGKYASEIEHIVMGWAAKHPEPQYPTWTEWLRMVSANGIDLNASISADIAEKLGIKPVGGDADA